MSSYKKHKLLQKGFSLVELSISLVIVGLLIAAVVAGSDMIKTAKLRGVVTEVQKYKVAIDSFTEAYSGLPGDITNAIDYFGDAGDCGNAVRADAPGTCNGNGDGMLSGVSAGDDTEPYTLWDQLSLAKMISGHYTGGGNSADIGVNCPRSVNFDDSGFSLRYYGSRWTYTDDLGRDFSGNYIMFGKPDGNRNDVIDESLTADDAFYLDSKMDDGKPAYGGVQSGNGGCTTGAGTAREYNFTAEGPVCTTIFNIGVGSDI